MRKRLFFIISILFILSTLSLSGCVSKSDYEKLQGELQTTQTSIENLNATVTSIQADLDSTKSLLDETQKSLAINEMNRKSLQTQLDTANGKIKLYQDTLGITVNSNIQPPYTKTSIPSSLMNLVNVQEAKDPTWQQLIDFILTDKTDTKTYVSDVFMCGGFAEEVHNNAEAAGIRAAVVGIDFTDGSTAHALNAFKTIDRGLVYVDCTGKGFQTLGYLESTSGNNEGWDKIAYVVKDKEYGTLALNTSDSTDYSFYQKEKTDWGTYSQKLDSYNQDVENYNAEIKGKVYYIGTPAWQSIKQWEATLVQQEDELNNLKANLIYMWEPLGIVSSIEIYW